MEADTATETMKYLCLIYLDEGAMKAAAAGELDAVCQEARLYEEDLRRNGRFVVAEALQPGHTAATVRICGGKATVTDGPFAETREQLGGFFLVEARDLNEAIQVASKIPPARLGCVEVRPIREIPLPQETGDGQEPAPGRGGSKGLG